MRPDVSPDFEKTCIDTLRLLAVDMVEAAKSGHPGLPLGAAWIAHVILTRHLRHAPHDPKWPDRDRFVLSAGHGSALLYAMLHLSGYDLPMEELRRFRQWGSRTPGHPENFLTPGVEVTTGPLGQGFANGVGMALAERLLADRYNRDGIQVVDHRVYAIVSDGDLMEGISSEAASLAGTMRLGRLTYVYDSNSITIDGDTSLTFREDVGKRFEAYGWHVQHVDGHDLEAIDAALTAAAADERPSLVIARTHIGKDSTKQDTPEVHGAALGAESARALKEKLGFPAGTPFHVPEEVAAHYRRAVDRGRELVEGWNGRLSALRDAHPELAADFDRAQGGTLPEHALEGLPSWKPSDDAIATRQASGKVLQRLFERVPELVGGSADLAASNNTYVKGYGNLPFDEAGRNVHFGVREHAMGAIANGMALHGGVRPYVATFLVFTDYMRPSIRLAALSGAPVVYVMTHDSIGLGEDGPTHQPVEHLASLRAMPNLVVLRPADANETREAWMEALSRTDGPTLLSLTRQSVPHLERPAGASARRGAYVLSDTEGRRPDVILIGTGSEVSIALAAGRLLEAEGRAVRVVSMPSWELFEDQPSEYQREVLPPDVRARVAVEAASPFGWGRWVGEAGAVVGVDRFGASAPWKAIYEGLGLTPEGVATRARHVLDALGA